jgi:hypothetical protein
MTFARLKPNVPKCWLFAASGVMWSVVGLFMCATGAGWLAGKEVLPMVGFEMAGIALAVAASRTGFGRIARKNIHRLRQLPQQGCFFAFQAWTSYLIIAVMIALGVALRHSPVPKPWLAIVYTGIGGALFLASFSYYRHLLRLMRAARRRRKHPTGSST